jgi:hypothetical protein
MQETNLGAGKISLFEIIDKVFIQIHFPKVANILNSIDQVLLGCTIIREIVDFTKNLVGY